MLSRLSSAASILRPTPPSPSAASDSESSTSRARSLSLASSALADAIDTPIAGDSKSIPTALAAANHELVSSLEALQGAQREQLHTRLELLARIQCILTVQPDTRDTFREHGGFLNAVSVLSTLEESADEDDSAPTFDLVTLVFAVLALAFDGHDVNRAAFADTVGFDAVGEAIKLSRLMHLRQADVENDSHDVPSARPPAAAERLLSILYAFLVDDFSSSPLYTALRLQLARDPAAPGTSQATTDHEPPSLHSRISAILQQRAESLHEIGGEVAVNPEVLPLMLDLQSQLSESPEPQQQELATITLATLYQLSISSRRSQIAFTEVGVLSRAVDRLFPPGREDTCELKEDDRTLWLGLARHLLGLGANTKETRALFDRVVRGWRDEGEEQLNDDVLALILEGVEQSRQPPSIHFDYASTGTSSLTMKSLGRPFPPSTHGYTLLAWVSIDTPPSPDENRLIIFGCGDAAGKCSLELSVTPDMKFALSTSLSSSPVRFEAYTIAQGQFVHVALVHQRPRISYASTVSLFIDGKLVDTSRVNYPVAPPKESDIQAWFGSPKDRVREGRLQKGLSNVKWDLGPAWLLHADLPEEMIYVCWTLGPRYTGNFQDQLGQFQTNATSTELNLRLDSLTRSTKKNPRALPTNSPLVYAVRDKGSAVVPEHRIYFAFNACSLVSNGFDRGIAASGLSDVSRKSLALMTAAHGNALFNSAICGNSEAELAKPHALAFISDATVCIPHSLDAGLWKIGGVSVALRLLELAATPDRVSTTVRLFIVIVGGSWRNSEDAERTQAYEILGELLRAKAFLVNSDAHEAILAFCGFDISDPRLSTASNVLAFRFLILDFSLWSDTDQAIQFAHLDHLRSLIHHSSHRAFNLRRLAKLHLVRKLLFALRADYFDQSMVAEAVDLLMLIVRAQFTTETIRHLATFLTATLCRVLPAEESTQARDAALPFISDVRQLDVGAYSTPLQVLQGVHDFLFETTSTLELQKFAKVITSKWLLLFMLDQTCPPLASVLAFRILVRLLQTQGPAYTAKFTNSSDGFTILRGGLRHLSNLSQIYTALFALIHEVDITTLGLDAPLATDTFLSSSTNASPVAIDAARVVVACLGRAMSCMSTQAQQSVHEQDQQASTGDEAVRPLQDAHIVIEMMAQATSGFTDGSAVFSSPNVLAEIIQLLRAALQLRQKTAPATTSSPLPLLTSRDGYAFSRSVAASAAQGLSIDIPELRPPLLTDGEPPQADASAFEASLSEQGAAELLQFLSQLVTHHITTRHQRKRSLSNLDLSVSPTSEWFLVVMRALFDAAASVDVYEQVAFRSQLIADIVQRLSRSSTAPLGAGRVSDFVEFATDLAIQGWLESPLDLLEFVLTYVEKLLDDSALTSPSQHSVTLSSLYKSANRLVLLSLADDDRLDSSIADVLVRHQLTLFTPANEESDFLKSLLYRLYKLALNLSDPSTVVDLFKLLVLQRGPEIEGCFGREPRQDFEPSFSSKLIDCDTADFVALLEQHSEHLDELESSWTAFVESEIARARPAVEKELARIIELGTTLKSRPDAHARRLRKQRAAVGEWSEGIHDVEATRVAHTRQDIADHSKFVHAQWAERYGRLRRGQGIWGQPIAADAWELDFTEGHCRIRKKLVQHDTLSRPLQHEEARDERTSRSLGASRNDAAMPEKHQLEVESVAPGASSPVSPEEERVWSDEPQNDLIAKSIDSEAVEIVPEEDKSRKVRRSLDSGDVIESVFNISRIAGLDACSGLLLFAKKNVYIIDGFFQTAAGEIVNSWEAPDEERDQHLQTLADLATRADRPSAVAADASAHRSRRWAWSDLLQVHERKYLFRDVALELFFADGRSFLLTFDKERRNAAHATLATKCPAAVAIGSLNVASSSFGAKFSDAVLGQRTKLNHMTKRWEQRRVSNFEYLTFLNTLSGRTYNDLTNYLVFPWVLADFTSEELDLTNPATFRDLSRPMGAQTEQRRKEFEERFSQLAELNDGTKPFHYGTHYSSAMIVVGYLVRLRPFTESYLDLQGGTFDHADRMFWSIPKAWESASSQSRSDVRELIPEFFYLPDFLDNCNKLELGLRQEDGTRIDTVILPPWARGDPRRFVELHRQALESDYVSAHLHEWIDLIFGYKSGTGEAAINSLNVFHHLSYEGAIDLDAIENADERRAATSTIHNFGMTPKQLFGRAHPARVAPLVAKGTRPIFSHDLGIEQQAPALVESIVPVLETGQQVARIYASTPDKTTASTVQSLPVPDHPELVLSWGFADQSLRVFAKGQAVPISLFEQLHTEFVSAACFADARSLVTGSTDSTLIVWRWHLRSKGKIEGHLQQLECLRGHTGQITCIAASRAFSVIVSGSDDHTAIVWDLNRRRFVRLLAGHEAPVHLIAVSDTTGDIVTCSAATLRVWSINGDLLAVQSTSNFVDPITAVAFSLSETAPIIATGHRAGKIMLWRRDFGNEVDSSEFGEGSPPAWRLTLLATLHHRDRLSSQSSATSNTTITALSFTARSLYVGDLAGRVWLYNPPGTEMFLPDSTNGGLCMGCSSKFGFVESRRRCTACAGIFCSLCSTTNVEVGGRFCAPCLKKLIPLAVV